MNDSGFNGNVPTLQTQLLADDSMLQVGAGGGAVGWLAGWQPPHSLSVLSWQPVAQSS